MLNIKVLLFQVETPLLLKCVLLLVLKIRSLIINKGTVGPKEFHIRICCENGVVEVKMYISDRGFVAVPKQEAAVVTD